MRTKITLLLLFLNVALFFFIFAFDRKWRTEEQAAETRTRVLGPEAANIQALAITGRTLPEPVQLEREGDTWDITSPYEWPANPHAVSRIVNELQFLEHETSFAVANLGATGLSLADYGLDAPPLTVTLTTGSGEGAATTELALGNRTEIGQRLYVLSPDGSRVHVVPDTLAQSLSLDLSQLRANSCFTIPVFEVRSLNLQNDGPANVRVRLRREGNRWRFESPVVARASKTATEVVLNDIASLRTADFLGAPSRQPELMAVAGVNSPFLRITLEGNNRRETLLLGNELTASDNPAAGTDNTPSPNPSLANREFYAQMEGRDALFTVVLPRRLADDLRNAQSELRDKAVLDLGSHEIDAVTLSDDDGREVTLQKVESSPSDGAAGAISTWQVVQRDADGTLRTQPADETVVQDGLLQTLRRLRATSFERDVPTDTELEDWGLTRPSRTITLSFVPGLGTSTPPPDVTLILGTDQTGTRVFAQVAPETFVYGVDPVILDQTPVNPLHYRERLLQELPAGARITGLRLRDLGEDAVLYDRQLDDGETWEVADAAAEPDRQAALRRLRTSLRTLQAAELVDGHFTENVRVTGQTRPWRYQLDVTLSVSGDDGEQVQSFTLYFAERDGGDRQLVGAPELDVVFVATPELISALWNLTYAARDPGPTELSTPPADPEPAAGDIEPAG
jgi:hypothetical protein